MIHLLCSRRKVMDDININEINIHLEEVKLDTDSDEWINLSYANQQKDTNDPDVGKEVVDNETMETQTEDNNSEICTNVESGDISDGISVISESDSVDVSVSHTCQLDNKPLKKQRRYIIREAMKTTAVCLFGVMVGFLLHMMSMYYIISPNQHLNRMSNDTFVTTRYNIINTYKELAEVKAMLSEIEMYIKATNCEISIKEKLLQVLKSINSSKINNKPVIESLDSNLHPLNQLQLFLRVLSSSIIKLDTSDFPNPKMNETLDIVNNVKEFHNMLIVLGNNTQNMNNFIIEKFLQNTADKIHGISQSLLSDLLEKMYKATLNVYNKYTKLVYKLHEKLCHLKHALPNDNEFLKLIENSQLFENYDKFCFSNYSSNNASGKLTVKTDTQRKNTKNRIEKADDPSHVSYVKNDQMYTYQIDNNNSSFLETTNNKTQSINSSTTKLPLSKKVLSESINGITPDMYDKYNKEDLSNKNLYHLEDIFNKDLLKLCKKAKKNGKAASISLCERINNILGLIGIKDIDRDSLNNIVISSHANNYCSKNNDMSTCDNSVSKDKAKDCIIISDDNDERNIAQTKVDSASVFFVTEKDGKQKKKTASLKSNVPTNNTVFNASILETQENDTLKKNTKHHVPQEEVISHRKAKSSFNMHATQQNDQRNMKNNSRKKRLFEEVLLQNDSNWYFLRSNARKNARKDINYKPDWYSERARARKSARKYIKYHQNIKFRRKHP